MEKDIVSFIQENVDPLVLLNYYNFQHITASEDYIRACCAIHNGTNPTGFVWNKKNNLWFCYTDECGGGDIFTLIEKIENVDFKTAVYKAANILGLDIKGKEFKNQENRILKEQKQWLQNQQKQIGKRANQEEYILPYSKYTDHDEKFNRFDLKTINHFGAKFCKVFPTEDGMHYNKLVIPLYENEKCIGAALRDITGTFKPKWFYVPKEIKINTCLYNLQYVPDDADEIILVEGIFDVWAYYNIGIQNVVAIFGSSLKKEQFEKLLQLGVNITLSFDNDEAGRKCTKQTFKLFENKTEVKIIQLPDGCDPADIDKKDLLSRYLNRTLYVQE